MYTKKSKDGYGNTGIFYYKDERCTLLHREDGPAIEYENGTKHWFINGKHHREDGPAIEWQDGSKEWYINGQLHREDGYAVEDDTASAYYLHGRFFFSQKEYLRQVVQIRFGGFI